MEAIAALLGSYGFPTGVAAVFIFLYTKAQDRLVQAYVDSLQKNTEALNKNVEVLQRVAIALERSN